MSVAKLKSELWVKAHLRLCDLKGFPAVRTRKGDVDAGAILIKVVKPGEGAFVLTQTRKPNGEAAWMRGTGAEEVDESAADAYIRRQIERDYDLWVIEVEDRKGLYDPDKVGENE